jgi:hypothetical protein
LIKQSIKRGAATQQSQPTVNTSSPTQASNRPSTTQARRCSSVGRRSRQARSFVHPVANASRKQ